jgi:hypothetical protein
MMNTVFRDMTPCSRWRFGDVSEEPAGSVFEVVE